MGCKAWIDDDPAEDPWCQSCIDYYSAITDEYSNNDYVTADEEEVWSLAYQEIYLPTVFTSTWDFPMFNYFIALSISWSCIDDCQYQSTSNEQDEEYAEVMLNW
jgi:hypothetical protein